jgi:NAD(P)-dependent dehydrogenase (short-subunit alcohol dehydrogenase family)
MSEDRFGLAGRTALITGAGGGLGREHALLFGSHGANVVVNDLGGSRDGSGAGNEMADKVVEEIKAAGGNAVANYGSVSETESAQAMVQTALDAFGSIDIVVNNAGILRDKSFKNMTEQDWDLVIAVHLKGAFNVTKAAWEPMREAKYGRVVLTSSASGLYGNFGQTNYGAAKAALCGLGQALAEEGAKNNIHTNIIAPLALSRMTEDIMPPEMQDLIKPEYVSPLVVYLCAESCEDNGQIYEVGAGCYARVETLRAKGFAIKPDGPISVDTIADNWKAINDPTGGEIIHSPMESTMASLKHAS